MAAVESSGRVAEIKLVIKSTPRNIMFVEKVYAACKATLIRIIFPAGIFETNPKMCRGDYLKLKKQ